jgi:protein tyrosine phosphatase (PTP) superfamily phosphohydrolase (DUF442 family)
MLELTPLSPDFMVSPQIGRNDITEFARQGFRGIVNNRPDGEALCRTGNRSTQLWTMARRIA